MSEQRIALLKAADQIESQPDTFDFHSIAYPREIKCGSPGCALGWVRLFAGLPGNLLRITAQFLGYPDEEPFYDEMRHLVGDEWQKDAALCAKGLRLIADKHFPVREGIPEDIRAIFEQQKETT